MAIRPIDVRRKEFRHGFRGYDANQVDDFLDAVADEFEHAYTENARMREEITSLRERLQQFEDLEGSIRSALVHAEQAANDLRESARREAENLRLSAQREADLTLQEAKTRSHQMLSDSSSRVERVQESYEALQEAKRNFTADFRHLLKTYTEVMENMEIASAKDIEASLRERLDTESIAVVREAAAADEAAGEQAAEEEADEPRRPDASAEATERIEPAELPGRGGPLAEEPETVEPEVEPSTAPGGSEQETVVSEPAAREEADQEEHPLAEEETSRGFFEREEEQEPPSEETDNRIFRASRFLRRRD